MYEAFWRAQWAAHDWGRFNIASWMTSFGVTLAVVDILWSHLNPHVFQPQDLLMALFFLRLYLPDNAAAAHFGISAAVTRIGCGG